MSCLIRVIKQRPTREDFIAHYKRTQRELAIYERNFILKITPLFNIQERIVKQKIDEEEGKAVPFLYQKTVDDLLFDEDQQVRAFIRFEGAILTGIAEEAGKKLASRFGEEFTPLRERVSRFVDKRAFDFSKNVTETTKVRLRATLKEGLDAGEGIPKLKKRVEAIYDQARGARAVAMARTETHTAMNFGRWEARQGSAIVKSVRWITTIDGRERDAHLDADGQTVKNDEKFLVGGEYLSFPGDPLGSAANTINCRCDTYEFFK